MTPVPADTRRTLIVARRFLVVAGLAVALLIPATADAASLTLKWSSLTSSITPGSYATAVVRTTAGAFQ